MYNRFSLTHNKFNIYSSGHEKPMHKILQQELGETNLMDALDNRIWFTASSSVYIRKDVLVPRCITYALLYNRQ